jgi:hypothetical protein
MRVDGLQTMSFPASTEIPTRPDHPRPRALEDYVRAAQSVTMLRRDWEFLFEQLKSAHALLGYMQRVANSPPVALGTEPVRYEFAMADQRAPSAKLDPPLDVPGTVARSVPLLPLEPAAYGEIVPAVQEDVAEAAARDGSDPAALLEVPAAVDVAPVADRAELGRLLARWLEEVREVPEGETDSVLGTRRWWRPEVNRTLTQSSGLPSSASGPSRRDEVGRHRETASDDEHVHTQRVSPERSHSL